VNGFAGGRDNHFGGFVEVIGSDAHAWVEVHYARAGWVAYDPTPPDQRLRAAAVLSMGQRLYELQSALELWWFRNVVEFDRVDQLRGFQAAWRAWHLLRVSAGLEHRPEMNPLEHREAWVHGRLVVLSLLAACSLGLAAVVGWRRRAGNRHTPRISPAYLSALQLLAHHGLVRRPADTARGFAAVVAETVSPDAAAAFAALTERYLAERFGGQGAEGLGGPAGACLRVLRVSLRA